MIDDHYNTLEDMLIRKNSLAIFIIFEYYMYVNIFDIVFILTINIMHFET